MLHYDNYQYNSLTKNYSPNAKVTIIETSKLITSTYNVIYDSVFLNLGSANSLQSSLKMLNDFEGMPYMVHNFTFMTSMGPLDPPHRPAVVIDYFKQMINNVP